MKTQNYKMTKFACYYANVAMSSVFCLPPVLFVTFKELYGISYTLLGTLVLVNFCTQLLIDLILSFFPNKFNIKKTITIMPLITALGLTIYALSPFVFGSKIYLGLLLGTVIFSVAAGLNEVLTSPVIAAIPSDNPDRDMSVLHSLYGYGVVGVVIVSSLFLAIFGRENWMYLTLFLAFLPIIASVLFSLSPVPLPTLSNNAGKTTSGKMGLLLCVLLIFFGSAAENSMTNWISGYIEKALNISKTLGDILGLALFATLLALGRSYYAKKGKNIYKTLLIGMCGAVICYTFAALSQNVIVSLVACVLTGLATSMLWPGSLILMEEKFSYTSVAAFALMAAGGDLGGSIGPQMLGAVADKVSLSKFGTYLADLFAITPEQAGLKFAMLLAVLFPIFGIIILLIIRKRIKK